MPDTRVELYLSLGLGLLGACMFVCVCPSVRQPLSPNRTAVYAREHGQRSSMFYYYKDNHVPLTVQVEWGKRWIMDGYDKETPLFFLSVFDLFRP